MSRRIRGTITALEARKTGEKIVDLRCITVTDGRGEDITLRHTSAPHSVFQLLRINTPVTLYVGGPFFFLPSRVFGAISQAGSAFEAPRAILWIPGACLILLVAVPLAMLPITLLFFPILILAAIWMTLISWSGMGARSQFKRDARAATRSES